MKVTISPAPDDYPLRLADLETGSLYEDSDGDLLLYLGGTEEDRGRFVLFYSDQETEPLLLSPRWGTGSCFRATARTVTLSN